ncbi:hypothetical protein GA565_11545 [Rouxiella sp. S1S-2]|uniref:hypothetical protein n=1 Tax=Rouxiella sp. S1S-2 TaxID=2653856 RepID=UPI001265737F|nr:hypothetical protein [Rouxiella sp. S1S-2]KAB7896562.1 hypothetical protein GA565_11545 [Rouxiella sp. S1S-2]
MNKFKSLGAAFVLLGAVGMSSTAHADLLPGLPIPVPDAAVCIVVNSILPATGLQGLTPAQIEALKQQVLGMLPGATVEQMIKCLP